MLLKYELNELAITSGSLIMMPFSLRRCSMTCGFYQEWCWCLTTLFYCFQKNSQEDYDMSEFLCLRYSVKKCFGFWRACFSKCRFLQIAASIQGVIQGLLFPQLEIFFVWIGKCSLKAVSAVLWNRSYTSSASSLINTRFQLIFWNEFLKFDKFSSGKTL